ncbi:MAG: IclR family transcriptional regulator [Crocinitomix sp. MedPE-SWsnd]|nr:MAG: IclR family transcriptional regulator [Crocinitomix sp. MedPE-SWsnd]
MSKELNSLLKDIRQCTICKDFLEPNPVLSVSEKSKILIVGQAPGTKVHASGIPWDDQSGKNLRSWLGVTDEQFYNPDLFGIVPMGFCYPGKGRSGDLPPRKECHQWHQPLTDQLPNLKFSILIGAYAQNYYLENPKRNLTENVQNFEAYLPQAFVLPHPSPRNRFWLTKNPWFQDSLLPILKLKVQEILANEV